MNELLLRRRALMGRLEEKPTTDYTSDYLTFIPSEPCVFSYTKNGTGNDLEYAVNNGSWISLAGSASTPVINKGDVIKWRGELTPAQNVGAANFASTGEFAAAGNITSILFGDNYLEVDTLPRFALIRVFYNNKKITDASQLIMPSVLSDSCCIDMFAGCSSLVLPPRLLPVQNLGYAIYQRMYKNCTALLTPSEFPELAILNTFCCLEMYSGCTSLQKAPNLIYTGKWWQDDRQHVVGNESAFNQMFYNCSSLNFVRANFRDVIGRNATNNWLSGVAQTGTFVMAQDTEWTETGASGVPDGWIVQYENI